MADPGPEERGGGARGFGYILANFGDFLKNLEKIRGGGAPASTEYP